MENREAIEWLKGSVVSYEVDNKGRPNGNVTCDLTQEVIDLAISALKKQIPKKPRHIDKNATFDGNWKRVCPACGRVLVERITTPEESYPRIYNHTPHCICGQAIDWEEE